MKFDPTQQEQQVRNYPYAYGRVIFHVGRRMPEYYEVVVEDPYRGEWSFNARDFDPEIILFEVPCGEELYNQIHPRWRSTLKEWPSEAILSWRRPGECLPGGAIPLAVLNGDTIYKIQNGEFFPIQDLLDRIQWTSDYTGPRLDMKYPEWNQDWPF